MPGAPGMIFSQTPQGSDFPMSYVGGLRSSPAATGQFVLEDLGRFGIRIFKEISTGDEISLAL